MSTLISPLVKYTLILLGFFLFCLKSPLAAQDIPIGTWRTHFSYQSAQSLAIGSDLIYTQGENGLFTFTPADRSLARLGKSQGLSEAGVAVLAYQREAERLLIAYENANLNLIQDGEIQEISLIRDANINGSKNINAIYFRQDFAYLASDFGLVILDLDRQEIQETLRNLAPGGEGLAIQAASISQDSLFLASEQGILRAALRDNLLDFNNWTFFSAASGLPEGDFEHLVSREGEVYAAKSGAGLYKYQHQGNWQRLLSPEPEQVARLRIQDRDLLMSLGNEVWVFDEEDNLSILQHPLFSNIQDAQRDSEGNLWLADAQNGLLADFLGDFQAFFPNGPFKAAGFSLFSQSQETILSSGGYSENYNGLKQNFGFYRFQNGFWENYNALDTRFSVPTPPIQDLVASIYLPRQEQYYFASFGQGLLRWSDQEESVILNSSLPGSTWQNDNEGELKISGLALGNQGDLWLSQTGVSANQSSLHRIDQEGNWESFIPNFSAARHPLGILIDFNQNKWLRLNPDLGGGIWVFNEEGNQSRYLRNRSGEGNLPSSAVYALTLDQEGQVWVGTDEGVAVFFNPFGIFQGSSDAIRPIFDQRPLLRNEVIRDILVDGGNRKWFATDNGLWLFNEDGSELIHHFRTDNSPLPSNRILDLSIQPDNGELFVLSDRGLVSYRSGATVGTSTHQSVKVFPNPVRPNFTGTVGITGLVNNANVKITDVSGRLFYETQAEGGSATWDLTDYNGVRAKTGIYLIFSSNFDGSETLVSKIAVIE